MSKYNLGDTTTSVRLCKKVNQEHRITDVPITPWDDGEHYHTWNVDRELDEQSRYMCELNLHEMKFIAGPVYLKI